MLIAQLAVALVVLLHVVFAAAESIGWQAFATRMGYSRGRIEATRQLAANQGAYNLGIAAMLGWSMMFGNWDAVAMLLAFIVVMGIVGALTVRWTIFVVQGIPAILGLALVGLTS